MTSFRTMFATIALATLPALAPDLAHAAQGDPLVVIAELPELTERQAEGQELFQAECASCHGVAGAGRIGVGPPLVHSRYRPARQSNFSFQLALTNGKSPTLWRFGEMPARPDLSETQIKALIDYIRAVQRANGIR